MVIVIACTLIAQLYILSKVIERSAAIWLDAFTVSIAGDPLKFSRDGRQINGVQITQRYRDDQGALAIVTEREGRDVGQRADIGLAYSIAADAFSIRKDVRFDGGEFLNRNEYRFTR